MIHVTALIQLLRQFPSNTLMSSFNATKIWASLVWENAAKRSTHMPMLSKADTWLRRMSQLRPELAPCHRVVSATYKLHSTAPLPLVLSHLHPGGVHMRPAWLLEPITDTSDERIPISGLPKIFQEAAESQSPMPTILGSTQFASCKMTQKMGMTRFALVVCLSTVPLPCPIPREDALNYCGWVYKSTWSHARPCLLLERALSGNPCTRLPTM